MKRVEKSGEGAAGKGENLGEKLRRVGKKGGQATPVASFWRPQESAPPTASPHREELQDFSKNKIPFQNPSVSARKLAAALWELHNYKVQLDQMHHGGAGGPLPRLRRPNHGQLCTNNSGLEPPLDSSPGSHGLPESSSSFRRHFAASLMQHHRSAERNNHALQPVSSTSYGSSMEIAPYNPTGTPTRSIEPRGRNGDTNYSLRTSTELLKVLNCIWSLEEQHVYNMSLVKSLKNELNHAHSQIKSLVREQQSDRREMVELMKQISDDKAVRKNKEDSRINAAILLIRNELEDERKLRNRLESLHRKLAKELYDAKMSLAESSREVENERRARSMLEDLCDEFAVGVRDYEREVRGLREKCDEDWRERGDRDQSIVHLSETWLDEQMQMKLQNGKSVVDKLRSEIEAFVQGKRISRDKINGDEVSRGPTFRRSSLESIPLNMAVSAPRDEEDDAGSDSNCFELQKTAESTVDEIIKQKQVQKKFGPSEKPSSLQVKFEEEGAQAGPDGESKSPVQDAEFVKNGPGNPVENSVPEKCKAAKESSSDKKYDCEGTGGMNSNYMIENLIRNHYLLSESGNKQTDQDYGLHPPIWRSQPSPVRNWTDKLPSSDQDASESSSKLHPDLKEGSLKAKLFEARRRGQRSRSRLKASVVPSRNE